MESYESELKQRERMLIQDKMMLTTDEARELLGLGRSTLEALSKAGYIRYLNIGNEKRYPRWALEEFTHNFIFKRINLKTLEVDEIENDYEEIITKLKNENRDLNGKLDAVRGLIG